MINREIYYSCVDDIKRLHMLRYEAYCLGFGNLCNLVTRRIRVVSSSLEGGIYIPPKQLSIFEVI